MALVVQGEYKETPPALETDGKYEKLQIDAQGRLKVSTSVGSDATVGSSDADIGTAAGATAVTGTHGKNANTGLRAEHFLAGASSRTGRIGTLAISGVMYVRLDVDDGNWAERAEWLVKSDKAHAVALYKSRAVVDSVTVTLGTADLDNGDTAVVNGKTFTAHTDTTVAATGQYAIDGNTAADCIELAKVLAPGKAITLASVVAADTVTVNGVTFTGHATTTTPASRQFDIAPDATAAAGLVSCINHKDNVTLATVSVADTVTVTSNGHDYVYTAAASAVVASGVFSQNGTDTQDGDSLVLCINHKDTITLASAIAGDSVTINGLVFEGKASTAVYQKRQFSIDTSDDAASISLAAAINDATWGVPGVTASGASGVVTLTPDTYAFPITVTAGVGGTNSHTRVVCAEANGVPGVTAVNSSGVVSLTRDYEDADITLTSSNGTRLACVAAKGVPGVLAAATDGGELIVTPVWKGETITVTSSDDTIKYVDYGLPGCKVSYTATTVVITPDMDSEEPCTCIYAVIGTADANEFTVTNGTLANLEQDGSAVTGNATITTNLGKTYEQYVDGYPYLYLGFTSEDAAAVSVPVVKATLFA